MCAVTGSWSGGPGQAPLLLADELWCLAHDDRTGRSRLCPRVLGVGLAAALLGELALFGRVVVTNDGDLAVVSGQPPPDRLAARVLADLMAHLQYRQMDTWLAYLAATSAESVQRRLAEAGLWQLEQRRRLGRNRVGGQPADPDAVAWRVVRLAGLLTSTEPLGLPDAVLAGLVAVTGLSEAVFWQPEDRPPGLARIAAEFGGLPVWMRNLLAYTEAAVGDAVLTPR